jgi:hypothetical protein
MNLIIAYKVITYYFIAYKVITYRLLFMNYRLLVLDLKNHKNLIKLQLNYLSLSCC